MIAAEAFFASLADPTRLRILLLVRDLELAMGELADVLDQSQPRVSRHVRILAEAGLLERHKEGAFVFVRPASSDQTQTAYRAIDDILAGRDLIAAERVRMDRVRAERQQAVDEWFRDNAEEWDLLRRLGGADEAVEQAIVEVARNPAVGRLLDIGTGTGRMLELLAAEATTAVGVDRSPEMLRVARSKLADRPVEVRQADMRSLPFEAGGFDTVTLHHVLHFADSPSQVLGEAARMVAPGGKLILADYGPHDREELRSRYHHLRLGFDEAQLKGWMEAAELTPRCIANLQGPELTVTLWEGRK